MKVETLLFIPEHNRYSLHTEKVRAPLGWGFHVGPSHDFNIKNLFCMSVACPAHNRADGGGEAKEKTRWADEWQGAVLWRGWSEKTSSFQRVRFEGGPCTNGPYIPRTFELLQWWNSHWSTKGEDSDNTNIHRSPKMLSLSKVRFSW